MEFSLSNRNPERIDRLINSFVFRDVCQNAIHFSERRQSTLPAAVTSNSAANRHGRRQKVRKPSFFIDRQAI